VDDYAFFNREQKSVIDNSQTIDQTESTVVDVINRNTITKVIFSYEENTHFVYTLKSIKISSLLDDENLLRQLNLIDISSDDYILVLDEAHIDIQQPIGIYSTIDNQPIHFRISTSVQITKYDTNERIKIPLSNNDTTIAQLLQLTGKAIDTYKYLASNDTNRIIDPNETLSNLNKTKFILLKENETCLLGIEKSKDAQLVDNLNEEDEKYQRYAIFATMADIYNENQIDILHQHLLYANEFVPSAETQLLSFQSQSPIRFIVIDDNLPVTVTVQHDSERQPIKFNCSHSMSIKRLCSISCHLFSLSHDCHQLLLDDLTSVDDDILLEDIDENMTEVQFQLVSITSICCSVTCAEQTFKIAYDQNTLAQTVVDETLKQLHVPYDDMDKYELFALNDERTQIDFDISMEDICELFTSTSTTISFELRKKNE
jgi:hypothetical protein